MKTSIVVAAIGIAVALAIPAGATGGNATFRIVVQGDFGGISLSSSCPNPSYDPPGVNPGGSPLVNTGTCWVIKNNLGYDGATGASWDSAGHPGHAFTCSVTSSATPGAESISIGFDSDGDTFTDIDYPNTVWRPLDETGAMPGGLDLPDNPTGVPDVDNNVPNSLNPGLKDGFLITGVLRGGFWPSVSGTIDGDRAIIFNHLGADLTVNCTY